MLHIYIRLLECRETAVVAVERQELSRGVHPVRGVSGTFLTGGASVAAYFNRECLPERSTRLSSRYVVM